MEKINLKQSKVFLEVKKTVTGTFFGERGARLTATAELEYIYGNKAPYFAVTSSVYSAHGSTVAGGCLHEEIAKAFPSLAPFLKWHLFNMFSGPMHYVANAVYWATDPASNAVYWATDPTSFSYDKRTTADNKRAFNSTVLMGEVETDGEWGFDTDTIFDSMKANPEFKHALKLWLERRFVRLMERFDDAMLELFGPEYNELKARWQEAVSAQSAGVPSC